MSFVTAIKFPLITLTLQSAIDAVTFSFIATLLLLSLLSLCFVLRLRFGPGRHHSHRCDPHPLQNFNSLWTVRLLLVSLVALWALAQLLPLLPYLRRRRLLPSFLRPQNLPQQAHLCKIHLLLSLGLLEPAFLVTILFLVNASVRKHASAVAVVFTGCLPFLLLQALAVFLPAAQLPGTVVFRRTSVSFVDEAGFRSVLCKYPLLETLIFGAFGIGFLGGFLVSCWRAVSVVINQGLRVRIYALAIAVAVSLSMQIAFLGLAELWEPPEPSYAAAALVVFVSSLACAVAGEGMLVILPIADALAVGGGESYCHLGVERRCQTAVMVDGEPCGGDGDGDGGGSRSGTKGTFEIT